MNSTRISKTVQRHHAKLEAARHTLHRCQVFRMLKRINKLPKKPMTRGTLEQIFGGTMLGVD